MYGPIDIIPAKQFYSEVFDWKFHPASEEHPADRVALFSFPDPKLSMLGGGIVKQKDKIQRGGVVYLYVNDIDLTVAVRSTVFAPGCYSSYVIGFMRSLMVVGRHRDLRKRVAKKLVSQSPRVPG